MKQWTFNGEPFTDDMIGDYVAFCYMITHLPSGRRYIGRKYFYNVRKVKNKRNRQKNDSNWRDYWGSSDLLQADIEKYGHDQFRRVILTLHTTRGDCNRTEVELQWKADVLYRDDWYNGSIGKYQKISKTVLAGRLQANALAMYLINS